MRCSIKARRTTWSVLALGASSLLALALLAPPAQGGMTFNAPKSQKASSSGPAQSTKPLMHQTGPKAPVNPSALSPSALNPTSVQPNVFNKSQPSAGRLPPGATPNASMTPKEPTLPTDLLPQFVKGVKEGEPLATFERIGTVDEGSEVGGGSGLYQEEELGGVSSKGDVGPAPSVPAEDNKSMLNEMHPGVKSGYAFELPRVDEDGNPLPPPGQSWPINQGEVKFKDERASINANVPIPPPSHVPPAKKDDDD